MNACCGMGGLMVAHANAGERCAQCGEARPDSVLSWVHETDKKAWYFCTPPCLRICRQGGRRQSMSHGRCGTELAGGMTMTRTRLTIGEPAA